MLKANFLEKQALIEGMMAKCKVKSAMAKVDKGMTLNTQAQNEGRRKSQGNMNVRRMTMLPVEEMRKLSQMVQVRRSRQADSIPRRKLTRRRRRRNTPRLLPRPPPRLQRPPLRRLPWRLPRRPRRRSRESQSSRWQKWQKKNQTIFYR